MAGVVDKVSYTHAAMIDMIVANPAISQGELARAFGYTQSWVCQLLQSDALREQLAARKAEIGDCVLFYSLEQRMNALAAQSIQVLQEKLEASPSADVALESLKTTTRALGYGVSKGTTVNVQQNYVVAMPEKEAGGQEWARAYGPNRPGGGGSEDGTMIDAELVP